MKQTLRLLKDKSKIKRILAIAIPSGLQSGLDTLSVSLSMFFVGYLHSDNIAVMGISISYILLFYPISSIFYIATNSQISYKFGQKDFNATRDIFSTLLYSVAILSIPTTIIALFLIDTYLSFLGAKGDIKALTYTYLFINIVGFAPMFIKNVITSGFSATGDTKTPFMVKIIATILSVFFSYSLVFGKFGMPSYGINGVAITAVFIGYLELLALIIIVLAKRNCLRLRLTFKMKYLSKGLKLGIPTGLERFFTLVSLSIILKFVTIYGSDILIGFQAGSRIETFSFVPGFGFMVAAMALMGQNLGAKNYKDARDYVKLTIIISSITMGILGLILTIFASYFSGFFIKENINAQYTSTLYLIAVGLSQIPLIWSFVYDGALRGAGITKAPLFINITSISLLRILPMWLCVHYNLEFMYLFVIIFIETYIRAFIFYLIFKSGIWLPKYKKNKLVY